MPMHRFRPCRRPLLSHRQQGGFGIIAALLVLVVLTVLGAAIARLSWTQQISNTQDLDSARAQRAANAGAEWGMYQALKGGWTNCAAASQTIDLRASLGVWVTVTCNSTSYVEYKTAAGADNLRVYLIDAVACNGASSCPDNARASGISYIERRRQVQVSDQ